MARTERTIPQDLLDRLEAGWPGITKAYDRMPVREAERTIARQAAAGTATHHYVVGGLEWFHLAACAHGEPYGGYPDGPATEPVAPLAESDERPLALSDAAAQCGLSGITLRQAVQRGRLKAERFGRAYFTRPSWLREYLDTRPERFRVH